MSKHTAHPQRQPGQRLLAVIRAIAITGIVVLMILSVLLYVLVRNLHWFQADITQQIQQQSGQNLRIAGVVGHWQGVHPALSAHAVALPDHDLAVDVVTVEAKLLESLQQGGPRLNRLMVSGIQIQLQTDNHGKLLLPFAEQFNTENESLDAKSRDAMSDNQAIRKILRQLGDPRLEIHNIRVNWPLAWGDLPAGLINLKLQQQTHGMKLGFRATLPDSFANDVAGNIRFDEAFNATQVALATDSVQLQSKLIKALPLDIEAGGKISTQIEAQIEDPASLKLNVKGQVVARQLMVDEEYIGDISGTVETSYNSAQGTLNSTIGNIVLNAHGPLPEVTSSVHFAEDKTTIRASFANADVQATTEALKAIPAVQRYHNDWMPEINVHGTLTEAKALMVFAADNLDVFRVDFIGKNLSLDHHGPGKIPAVGPTDATGVVKLDGITLGLDAEKLEFSWPGVMEQSIHAATTGNLWLGPDRERGKWVLRANDLRLDSTHGLGELDLFLTLEREPYIAANMSLTNTPMKTVLNMVPVTVSKTARDWIRQGLVSGKMKQTQLRIEGPVLKVPFFDDSGTFLIDAEMENAVIKPTPDFPALFIPKGRYKFHNNSMEATATNAKSLDVDISNASFRIADVSNPVIDLDLTTTATLKAGIDYTLASPALTKLVPIDLNTIKTKGRYQANTKLSIPLANVDNIKVKGEARIIGGTVITPDLPEPLRNLNGRVSFDETALQMHNMKMRYKGDHVVLSTKPKGDNLTQIKLYTDVSVNVKRGDKTDQLREIAGDMLTERLRGTTRVHLDLLYNSKIGYAKEINIRTDLKGLRADLPQPFGKSKNSRVPVTARLHLNEDGSPKLIFTNIEKRIGAAIELKDAKLHRAKIILGGGKATLPKGKGLYMYGRLPKASAAAIQGLIDGQPSGQSGASSAGIPDFIRDIDITVDELTLAGKPWKFVRFRLSPKGSHWLLRVNSADTSGVVTLPNVINRKNVITVHLNRLRLDQFFPAGEVQTSGSENTTAASPTPAKRRPTPASNTDPRIVPPIDFTCDEVWVGTTKLGKASVSLVPGISGIHLNNLKMKSRVIDFTANGDWTIAQGHQHSSLRATLVSKDINALLTGLGFAGQITAKQSKLVLRASWDAPLVDFSLATTRGQVDLQIIDGELIAVDPGGAARFFGLFSFINLPRRLLLDFSDVTADGLTFDSIKGSFTLGDGEAYTTDMAISSGAATVRMVGKIGLQTRTFEQWVTVVPHVGSSIAVVSGLLTTSQIGAALLLLQPVFGNPIEEMAALYFKVSGPWDNPTFEQSGGDPLEKPKERSRSRGPRR